MATGGTYNWGDNTFWRNIVDRKHHIEKGTLSGTYLKYDEQARVWRQECSPTGSTLPALLQNRYIVVYATDHGLGIYPLPLGGRYFLRPSFTVQSGSKTWNTHPQADTTGTPDDVQRSFLLGPGEATLVGNLPDGLQYTVRTVLPPSFPLIIHEFCLRGLEKGAQALVTPELLWMPGTITPADQENMLWLQPGQAPIFDEVVCRNNSTAADPQRPDLPVNAGVGIALTVPSARLACKQSHALTGEGPLVVGDQLFQLNEFERLHLTPIQMEETGEGLSLTLVIGLCETPEIIAKELERWHTLNNLRQEQEKNSWAETVNQIRFTCPSPAIEHQVPYSVHNSLFSRSFGDEGRTIFIHGRRDRGYGDCSKIHQSFQMYAAALAAGEGQSVREELLAYAALQDARGDVARQPRPGSGWHPYVGLYSTANYLMAAYRYLCWTGDFTLLDERVESIVETGDVQSVLDRLVRGADWLLANRWQGLVAPCGWVDAWPAGVKSQSQISVTTYTALDQLANIFENIGRTGEMKHYREEALALRTRIMEVFYNPQTGLFGEYLFEDGTVAGDQVDDFWSVTQIWAALAGLTPDTRGLDFCRLHCLTCGIVMYPETVLQASYMLQFTDEFDDIPIHAVATYGLAAWPELTHLYALAEIKYNRPDLALEALHRQLPETIHTANPYSSPTYYAEKYLYPYNDPWQCTWGGDPTFLQTLIEGFCGAQVDLNGLTFRSTLPESWSSKKAVTGAFWWQGCRWEVDLNLANEGTATTITVDEKPVIDGRIPVGSFEPGVTHQIKIR